MWLFFHVKLIFKEPSMLSGNIFVFPIAVLSWPTNVAPKPMSRTAFTGCSMDMFQNSDTLIW